MPWWEELLDALVALLVVVALAGAAIVARRTLLARHGGTFELSYRVRATSPGRGWVLGTGRYTGDRLEWFRFFSLWPRPKCVWHRGDIAFDSTRDPVGAESMALFSDHVIVVCHTREGEDLEVAMGSRSLIGFQAWIESRNPGTDWVSRRAL
jgi:hypothetical protein